MFLYAQTGVLSLILIMFKQELTSIFHFFFYLNDISFEISSLDTNSSEKGVGAHFSKQRRAKNRLSFF